MTSNQETKGSTATRLAGLAIIFHAVIVFAVMLISHETFTMADLVLLIVSFVAFATGFGVLHQNYYAWVAAITIAAINLLAHLYQIINAISSSSGPNVSNITTKAIWPLLIFTLVYASKQVCSASQGQKKFADIFTDNFPCLIASFVCLATVLAVKTSGNTGFLLLGFPAFILEFGLIYVVGLNLQKRYLTKC